MARRFPDNLKQGLVQVVDQIPSALDSPLGPSSDYANYVRPTCTNAAVYSSQSLEQAGCK